MPHRTPKFPRTRTRSLAEWSFLYRRRNVLRAIRHRRLTPAAKQVLVHLSLLDDDPFVLAERPDVAELARRLALAERTVRQAIAELVEQGCLTFRQTGEVYRAGEPHRPSELHPDAEPPPAEAEARPDLARPDLVRESEFLSAARGPISFAEHVDMLGHLRDRAVAARRLATAVAAERAIGRALGLGRAPAAAPREESDWDKVPRPQRKRHYFDTHTPTLIRCYAEDPRHRPELRRFCDQAEMVIRESRAAAAARRACAQDLT